MSVKSIIIVPGNGDGDVFTEGYWYRWVFNKLTAECPGIDVRMKNMPDPTGAKEKLWIPFMKNKLDIGEDSVIIGHSSGAVAAVRFCETYKVRGIIIVGAYTTDCGDENETLAGYFDRPWEWEKVKNNTDWVVQFGSEDDPLLAWVEQNEVANGLNAEFHKFTDRGHFMDTTLPEVVKVMKKKLMLNKK